MKQKELNKKVQLLKAGQIVEIDADYFRAVKLPDDCEVRPCEECDLDSICHGDLFEVCCEMETLGSNKWLLKLAHP